MQKPQHPTPISPHLIPPPSRPQHKHPAPRLKASLRQGQVFFEVCISHTKRSSSVPTSRYLQGSDRKQVEGTTCDRYLRGSWRGRQGSETWKAGTRRVSDRVCFWWKILPKEGCSQNNLASDQQGPTYFGTLEESVRKCRTLRAVQTHRVTSFWKATSLNSFTFLHPKQ